MECIKRWFFKRLSKESWRLKNFLSALKWKRNYWPFSFINYVNFKIKLVFETMVLFIMLSFFYLCCGCTF
ncbi:hypothetical protein MtrunA17_Chr1g0152631 [Medicago truncatula]|nr:hypothetical protein MtrunA17_Chr1g0152631 [Medicago truncatula]